MEQSNQIKMRRIIFPTKRSLTKSNVFCLSLALASATIFFNVGFQKGVIDDSRLTYGNYGSQRRLAGRRLSNVHIIEEIDDSDNWEGVELRRRKVKIESEESGDKGQAAPVDDNDEPPADDPKRPKSQNDVLGISTLCTDMVRQRTNVVLYNSQTMCASHVLLNMAKYTNNVLFVEDLKDPLHKSSHPERDLVKYVDNKPRPSLFHFHTRYCHISSNEDRNISYISMVRNPLERLVAAYHADMHIFTKAGVKVKSYSECVMRNDKMCVGNWTKNTIVRHFCGYDIRCEEASSWAFERARLNIASNYLVIGVVSEYERFIKLLEKLAPTVFRGYEDSDTAISKILDKRIFANTLNELEPEAKTQMEKHIQMDMRLYNFIRERFRKQIAICNVN